MLQIMYNILIQAHKQKGIKVLAKTRSNAIYIIISKSWQGLKINCVSQNKYFHCSYQIL
jgi:hypothetical protein